LRTKSVRIDGFQPLVDIAKALKIQGHREHHLQDVRVRYKFEDGKMITDPFDVKIDRIKANVGGSTAFADQAIDYDMKAKIPSDMFGAACGRCGGRTCWARRTARSGQLPSTCRAGPHHQDHRYHRQADRETGVRWWKHNVKEVIVTEIKQD
jgi:hypothetical protein